MPNNEPDIIWEAGGLVVYRIDTSTKNPGRGSTRHLSVTLSKHQPGSTSFEAIANSYTRELVEQIIRRPESWARSQVRRLLKKAHVKVVARENGLATARREEEELARIAEQLDIQR